MSVYLVFTVTISLFPAVLSQVVSSAPNRNASSWTGEPLSPSLTLSHLSLPHPLHCPGVYYSTLVCFLMFNVSDLTGRYITHWVQVGLSVVSVVTMITLLSRWVVVRRLFCCWQLFASSSFLPSSSAMSRYHLLLRMHAHAPLTLVNQLFFR